MWQLPVLSLTLGLYRELLCSSRTWKCKMSTMYPYTQGYNPFPILPHSTQRTRYMCVSSPNPAPQLPSLYCDTHTSLKDTPRKALVGLVPEESGTTRCLSGGNSRHSMAQLFYGQRCQGLVDAVTLQCALLVFLHS